MVLITDFVCKHLINTNGFILPVGSEVFPLSHKEMRCSTGIMQVVQCHTVTEYRSPELLCSIYSQVNPSETVLPSCSVFSASFPTSLYVRKNLFPRSKFAMPPSAHKSTLSEGSLIYSALSNWAFIDNKDWMQLQTHTFLYTCLYITYLYYQVSVESYQIQNVRTVKV